MDKSYEVTPEDEAITQEIYIHWVQDITMCAALEHWFEAVGRYAPIDIQDNISIGKKI
jgi:hypothetical protein